MLWRDEADLDDASRAACVSGKKIGRGDNRGKRKRLSETSKHGHSDVARTRFGSESPPPDLDANGGLTGGEQLVHGGVPRVSGPQAVNILVGGRLVYKFARSERRLDLQGSQAGRETGATSSSPVA